MVTVNVSPVLKNSGADPLGTEIAPEPVVLFRNEG